MAPVSKPAVQAAGAVVWRERRGRLEVAVVHRPRYRDWSWPKGKLEPGEHVAACAVREVEEETGRAVVLGTPLPGQRYRTRDGHQKQVHYWAARLATADDDAVLAARGPVQRAGVDEIDDVVWVRASTAEDLLTRATDRPALERLVELWSAGRLRTRPLAVVRHGKAVRRADWSGDDASRPLTAEGEQQAGALVGVLAAFGITRVVTSPWERCVRTAEPYATAAGVEPEAAEVLSQAAFRRDSSGAVELVRDLLGADRATALVTHRPTLAGVVPTLAEAARRWTEGRLPQKNPWLEPGEALVAHVADHRNGPRLVATERHHP